MKIIMYFFQEVYKKINFQNAYNVTGRKLNHGLSGLWIYFDGFFSIQLYSPVMWESKIRRQHFCEAWRPPHSNKANLLAIVFLEVGILVAE